MKTRTIALAASILLTLTACGDRAEMPTAPPADHANDTAPVDTTSRGPGMMGGGL